jgi:hypothetical protein
MTDLFNLDEIVALDALLDEGLALQPDTLARLVATARTLAARDLAHHDADPIAAREQGTAALEQAAIMVAAHYEQLRARNLPHDLVADVHHVLITGAQA